MLGLIARIGTEFGISVVVCSHLLGEVERICDSLVAHRRAAGCCAPTDDSADPGQRRAGGRGRRGRGRARGRAQPARPRASAGRAGRCWCRWSGDATYDLIRGAVAELDLPLHRLDQRRHRVAGAVRETAQRCRPSDDRSDRRCRMSGEIAMRRAPAARHPRHRLPALRRARGWAAAYAIRCAVLRTACGPRSGSAAAPRRRSSRGRRSCIMCLRRGGDRGRGARGADRRSPYDTYVFRAARAGHGVSSWRSRRPSWSPATCAAGVLPLYFSRPLRRPTTRWPSWPR